MGLRSFMAREKCFDSNAETPLVKSICWLSGKVVISKGLEIMI